MDASQFAKLQRQPSAIAPYTWTLTLVDGTTFDQYQDGRLRFLRDVDPARVRRLTLHGHASGDLHVEAEGPVLVAAIIARGRNVLIPNRQELQRTIVYGLRLADGAEAVQSITEDGRVGPYQGPALLSVPRVDGGP